MFYKAASNYVTILQSFPVTIYAEFFTPNQALSNAFDGIHTLLITITVRFN